MTMLLNFLLWTPMVGSLILCFFPRKQIVWVKYFAIFFSAIPLVCLLFALSSLDFSLPIEKNVFFNSVAWISSFHINYSLGLDGLSYPLLFSASLLFPILVIASWGVLRFSSAYFALLLLAQGCASGILLSLDLFLFFVFWELALVPIYFLLSVWGGARREFAATKFFLYTFVGSLLLLVGIIAIYCQSGMGVQSFNLLALQGDIFRGQEVIIFHRTFSFPRVLFWLLFVGFSANIPVFPFHTWLPRFHSQATTPVSALLSGVMLMMGGYGMLRILCPLLPSTMVEFANILGWLGLINILYGALCSLAQSDMKKLIAYSCVSSFGFVLIGISTMSLDGLSGAYFQLLNQGVMLAALFLICGVLFDQKQNQLLVQPDGTRSFMGMALRAPRLTFLFLIIILGLCGLPGLSGFVFYGFDFGPAISVNPKIVTLSGLGIIIGAFNFLGVFARIFLGASRDEDQTMVDLNWLQVMYIVPLLGTVSFAGIYHGAIISIFQNVVSGLVSVPTTIFR